MPIAWMLTRTTSLSQRCSRTERRIGRTRRVLSRMHAIVSGYHCSTVNRNGMMAKSMSSMRRKSQLRDERVRKITTGATMTNNLKLLCVLAHPDDESLGTGCILSKYASERVETYLVTATRGERGWLGSKEEYPGEAASSSRGDDTIWTNKTRCAIELHHSK